MLCIIKKQIRETIRIAKTGWIETNLLLSKDSQREKTAGMSFKKIKTYDFYLFFFVMATRRTKGYLRKKAGLSDSILKTYHLISEPAFKTSKGSHYIFSKCLMVNFISKGQLSASHLFIFFLCYEIHK